TSLDDDGGFHSRIDRNYLYVRISAQGLYSERGHGPDPYQYGRLARRVLRADGTVSATVGGHRRQGSKRGVILLCHWIGRYLAGGQPRPYLYKPQPSRGTVPERR